jgi:hypothetical protein
MADIVSLLTQVAFIPFEPVLHDLVLPRVRKTQLRRILRNASSKASRDVAAALCREGIRVEDIERIAELYERFFKDNPAWFDARKAVATHLSPDKLAGELLRQVPLAEGDEEYLYEKIALHIANQMIVSSQLLEGLERHSWNFTLESLSQIKSTMAQESTLGEVKSTVNLLADRLEAFLSIERGDFGLKLIDDEGSYFAQCEGEFSMPKFVRPWGPAWVDFRHGVVWEDKCKINGMITKLREEEGPVILKGEAASGKSVLLRAVAYHLTEEFDASVYYIPVKPGEPPRPPEKFPFRDFEMSEAFLFIDDAHLNNADWIRRFWEDPECSDGIKSRTLVASRPIEQTAPDETKHHTFPYHPGTFAFALENADEMRAADTLEPVFDHWRTIKAKELGQVRLSARLKADILEQCGKTHWREEVGDLWLLAFHLDALERQLRNGQRFRMPSIDLELASYLTDGLRKMHDDKTLRYSDEVMLPLAYAFRSEMPLPRTYVDELLISVSNFTSHFKRAEVSLPHVLNRLIDLREVIHSEETDSYSIPHSARAQAFWRAYQNVDELGRHSKAFLMNVGRHSKADWRLGLLEHVTNTLPKKSAALLVREEEHLLMVFATSPDGCSAIATAVLNAEDDKDAALLVNALSEAGYTQMPTLLNHLTPKLAAEKIRKTKGLYLLDMFVSFLLEAGYTQMPALLNRLTPKLMEEKIRETDDLIAVAHFMRFLLKAGYKQMPALLNRLTLQLIEKMIRETQGLYGIAELIDFLVEVGYGQMLEVLQAAVTKMRKSKERIPEQLMETGSLLVSMAEAEYSMDDVWDVLDEQFVDSIIRSKRHRVNRREGLFVFGLLHAKHPQATKWVNIPDAKSYFGSLINEQYTSDFLLEAAEELKKAGYEQWHELLRLVVRMQERERGDFEF